ncbi:hypothetical protein BC628DRAFT_43429 [Trametes gibbosa]|nr:hypothetical protein BC628DRAFT_43429 [Trametes gibbosa]
MYAFASGALQYIWAPNYLCLVPHISFSFTLVWSRRLIAPISATHRVCPLSVAFDMHVSTINAVVYARGYRTEADRYLVIGPELNPVSAGCWITTPCGGLPAVSTPLVVVMIGGRGGNDRHGTALVNEARALGFNQGFVSPRTMSTLRSCARQQRWLYYYYYMLGTRDGHRKTARAVPGCSSPLGSISVLIADLALHQRFRSNTPATWYCTCASCAPSGAHEDCIHSMASEALGLRGTFAPSTEIKHL